MGDEWLNTKELAAVLGVKPPTITEAYKKGRITDASCKYEGKRRYYHRESAVQEYNANQQQHHARFRNDTPEKKAFNDPITSKIPPIVQSKAIQAAYQARIAKIDYEEKSGKLVDAKTLERKLFTLARHCREKLLAIPDRVSTLLASETDPIEIHKHLESEIEKSLEDLQRIAL